MHVLLPLLLISITQLNRPTLTPGSSATTVFVVNVTNTSIAPVHLTRLGFTTFPTDRRQYGFDEFAHKDGTVRPGRPGASGLPGSAAVPAGWPGSAPSPCWP